MDLGLREVLMALVGKVHVVKEWRLLLRNCYIFFSDVGYISILLEDQSFHPMK